MTPEQFKQARLHLNVNQTELCALVGKCVRTIRYYESGKYPIPKSTGSYSSSILLHKRINILQKRFISQDANWPRPITTAGEILEALSLRNQAFQEMKKQTFRMPIFQVLILAGIDLKLPFTSQNSPTAILINPTFLAYMLEAQILQDQISRIATFQTVTLMKLFLITAILQMPTFMVPSGLEKHRLKVPFLTIHCFPIKHVTLAKKTNHEPK